ncbi:MAG: MBL fold metallo-hydrolase [Desulfurococcales archaeon]|nr:MBL fold metallo-hydrolase [Desulfurococcales archaeon]
MKVTIEWYGHSYVRIITASNARIVIDPHDGGSLNLPEFRVEADYALITHNHYDHNAVEMLRGNPKVLRSFRGETSLGDAHLIGLRTYHDKANGSIRGDNTVYILRVGPIRIAHLGDIGHLPEGEILDALKNVDVLMLPVGGVYTIDAYEAWETVELTGAKVVLPLHYWTHGSTAPLDSLDRFLEVAKAGRTRLDENRFSITRETLESIRRTIIVMPEPRSFARE